METTKINVNELTVGAKVLSVKTQEVLTVTSIGDKIELVNESGEVKSLSSSTLQRWYKLILGSQEVEADVQVDKVENIEEEVTEEQPVIEEATTEVEVPIQPAIEKPAKKHAPNQQEQDPVLLALRTRLIEMVLEVCPQATVRETSSYTALRVGKYNFAEVYKGKRRFTFRIISKAIDASLMDFITVAPETYGWTLDGTFAVLSEMDFETALEVLKQSYAYRATNTPDRGFKQTK